MPECDRDTPCEHASPRDYDDGHGTDTVTVCTDPARRCPDPTEEDE